jgi:amidase
MSELRRRTFLELGALALACGQAPRTIAEPRPITGPRPIARPAPAPFALEEKSIAELGAMLRSGEESGVSLVDQYLARIAAVDGDLGAIIELNPEARAQAAARDREKPRGPLHGIPIVLKDNIATAAMETTAGSLALVGHRAPRDATIVTQLVEAGAVILAKANLSEWANMRSRFATSGWSSRGGQTRNPYAAERNACGSSTGSAVAVAASLCAAAIGTETLGSIVCPASACGVVGLKPTVGRWSRAGIIPISHSTDTAGPIARSVADVALILAAVGRHEDPRDARTREVGALGSIDLEGEALRGARIGVARSFFGFLPAVDALIERAVDAMRERGAEIVDPIDLSFRGPIFAKVTEVFLYELKTGLEAYLAELGPSAPKTLGELIAFNRDHADEVMPFFGQDLFIAASDKGGLDEPAYREALATIVRAARDDGIDRVVAEHDLDAIVGPSGGPAWLTDHILGDHFLGGSSAPAAIAGYPHLTVPAGEVSGLPVGISFFGPAESEPRLLAIAHGYEQATQHRRPPPLG